MKTGTTFVGRLLVLLAFFSLNAVAGRLAPPLSRQASVAVESTTGAEILQSRSSTYVNSDLSWTSTDYFSIRINDLQAARDYGRISIGYNHYYSEFKLEFANVLTPDGTIKSVKPDAMQERAGGSQDFYEDRTNLVFSLPDIAPGSIIEFQYRRKSKKVVMPGLFTDTADPYWYQPTVGGDGGRVDPVLVSEHTLNYPRAVKMFYRREGPVAPVFASEYSGDRRIDRWQWRDMPAVPIENMADRIDHIMSRVKISTMTDWANVSRWSWGLSKDKFVPGAAVAKVARSLKLDGAGREAKIEAVYAYLQQHIRYVFAHLGRGGYEPHFASEVLQQGYGDCKDQTILAVALLKALGVKAYPALVVSPRNGRPDMSVVSLVFDHMIVYIPGRKSTAGMWMDTTADHALFPGVSNYLLNQPVLVVDGKSGKLRTLNDQLPENRALMDMNYHVDHRGHMLVDAEIILSGTFEQFTRSWWIHNSNRETALEQLVENIFPDSKSDAGVTAKMVNVDNLWRPVKIKARFDFGSVKQKNKDDPLTYGVALSQLYRLYGDFNSLQIPRDRKSPWVNELREKMQIRAVFSGRKFDVPLVLSEGKDIANTFYKIRQRGGRRGSNHYAVDIDFSQPPLHLSVKDYRRYYKSLQNLSDSGSWVIRFAKDKTTAGRAEISHADNSLPSLLKKVRFHLAHGEFEQALKPAREAVNIDARSGEAWYLLGLAQGYNAMIDESKRSFAKATDLGYSP